MPKTSFHSVHKYFHYYKDQDLSICKVHGCEKNLQGRHAGNLSKHLKQHPELYMEFLATEAERRRSSTVIPQMLDLDQLSSDGEPKSKMMKVDNKPKAYVTIQMDQSTFLNGLITLCSANGHPFSIVDDSGMRQIIDPICRAFRMNIDSTTISLLVQERANHIVQLMKQEVGNRTICLKLDTVHKDGKDIIGVNAQFTEGGTIHNRTLAASEINFSTHAEFSEYITSVLQKYDIEANNVFALVVDSFATVAVTNNLLDQHPVDNDLSFQAEFQVIQRIEQEPFHLGKTLQPVRCAAELFHSAVRQANEAMQNCTSGYDQSVLEVMRVLANSLQNEIFLPSDFFALWTKTLQEIKKMTSECAKIFYSSLSRHQNLLSSNSALLCATYLDPRFRMLLAAPQLSIAKEYILNNVTMNSEEENQQETESSQTAEEDDFEKLLVAAGKQWPCESNGRGQVRREIDCYDTLPHLKRTDNPVSWWAEQTTFPALKDFALATLSLPVTQFSSKNLSLHFTTQAADAAAAEPCQNENVFLVKANSSAYQNAVY